MFESAKPGQHCTCFHGVMGMHRYSGTELPGRMPCLAAYTRFKVNWRDRIKLSLLHGSGNLLATTSKRNVMCTVPLLHRSGNEGVES
jgi:hypothetical protein